jgi:lipopolysaccharide export system protein LptA
MSNKYMRAIIYKFCILLVMFLVAIPSYALKGDDKKPVQIEANSGTGDQNKKVLEFIGNVVITKGSLIVHADKGVASQDNEGNRIFILYGKPVSFEQIQDDGVKIVGQGDKFEYNTKSNLAVLTGRAKIRKAKSEIVGDVLTYNTQTQVYSAQSNFGNGVKKTSGGRITVILDQGQK